MRFCGLGWLQDIFGSSLVNVGWDPSSVRVPGSEPRSLELPFPVLGGGDLGSFILEILILAVS